MYGSPTCLHVRLYRDCISHLSHWGSPYAYQFTCKCSVAYSGIQIVMILHYYKLLLLDLNNSPLFSALQITIHIHFWYGMVSFFAQAFEKGCIWTINISDGISSETERWCDLVGDCTVNYRIGLHQIWVSPAAAHCLPRACRFFYPQHLSWVAGLCLYSQTRPWEQLSFLSVFFYLPPEPQVYSPWDWQMVKWVSTCPVDIHSPHLIVSPRPTGS